MIALAECFNHFLFVFKQGSYLSAFTKSNNEKREQQNEKKKRNQQRNHPILLTGPSFPNFQNDDNFQIDQPNVVYQPQPIFSQNEDNYNDDQEGRKELDLDISPLSPRQYPHPILNFLIHQEDDGGILIEPDHDMATSSSGQFRKSLYFTTSYSPLYSIKLENTYQQGMRFKLILF